MTRTNFCWLAQYSDDTVLQQYHDNTETLFRDIDFSKISSFNISNDAELLVRILINDGIIYFKNVPIVFGHSSNNKLIYFRRVQQQLSTDGAVLGSGSVIHIFGLQTNYDGRNRKVLFGLNDITGQFLLVTDDGS